MRTSNKGDDSLPPVNTIKLEKSMTPAEVAEKLQLHSKTVIKPAERGTLPGRKLGNRWRFLPSVIDAWMRGGK